MPGAWFMTCIILPGKLKLIKKTDDEVTLKHNLLIRSTCLQHSAFAKPHNSKFAFIRFDAKM